MSDTKLLVRAGPHGCDQTPVSAPLEAEPPAARLRMEGTGTSLPCQWLDGALHFVVEKLAPDGEVRLRVDPGETGKPGDTVTASRGVRVRHVESAHRVDVRIGGRLFTTYEFDPRHARPHFYPFVGPGGAQMTRHHPMRGGVDGETTDHVHHRGVWVGLGDVNGTDNWTEEAGHARQVHRGLIQHVSGSVLGQFAQALDWVGGDGRKVMEETRTVRVYRTANRVRIMELESAFTASVGHVRIGDTKEGGVCAVRVPTPMDGDKGGRIQNSFGGVGERETWGKPAHWCDYSGVVDGAHVGIAVFDHPFNLRHPTHWHVRDYGLMAANPFALSDYRSGLLTDGSHTIAAGSTLVFRYRLFAHRGDARRARVADRYHDYVNPPVVERV